MRTTSNFKCIIYLAFICIYYLQVYLEENNSGQVAAYRPVSTEVITWDGSSQSVTFNLKSLRYLFPKGNKLHYISSFVYFLLFKKNG